MRIGFIGLGNMGSPMAPNLAAAQHCVRGYDPTGVYPPNITSSETARQAIEGAEVVILMLPNGPIVSAITADILPEMQPGAVLLDCSTIDVETSKEVALVGVAKR